MFVGSRIRKHPEKHPRLRGTQVNWFCSRRRTRTPATVARFPRPPNATMRPAATRPRARLFGATAMLAVLALVATSPAPSVSAARLRPRRRGVKFTNSALAAACESSSSLKAAEAKHGDIGTWDTSEIEDMGKLFNSKHQRGFNSNIDSWQTSQVTSTTHMFATYAEYNQPMNSWRTESLVNAGGMFFVATHFNQNIDSWQVGKVVDAHQMFYNNVVFNQPLNSWRLNSVKSAYEMFYANRQFNQPLNSWQTSNLENMQSMFSCISHKHPAAGCRFSQPLNSWDTGSAKTMHLMFDQSVALNQVTSAHRQSLPAAQT